MSTASHRSLKGTGSGWQAVLSQSTHGLSALSAIATFFCVAAPRIAPLLIVAVMLAISVYQLVLLQRRGVFSEKAKELFFRPEIVFVAWVLVACLWSANFEKAIVKAVFLAALVMHAYVLASTVSGISNETVRALARGIVAGVVLGGVYICIELWQHNAILRFLLTHVPGIERGFEKHSWRSGGVVTQLSPAYITRVSAAFCLLLCPAALAAYLYAPARKWIAYGLLVGLALIVTFHPDAASQSAQIAIPAAAAVFFLAMWAARLARWMVMAAFGGLILLMVPFSLALFSAGLHQGEVLFVSAQHRVIIWNYTAEQVLKSPIIGVGTNSTRYIDEERRAEGEIEKPDGYVTAPATRAHPHNIYLQIWYELGAVGALAFAALGFWLLLRIGRLPPAMQVFALAHFTMVMVIILPTYGLWQSWFQSLITITSVAIAMMATHGTRPAPDRVVPAADPVAA